MPGCRFPAPWTVEELDAMTRHTKSKNEAIEPDQQDFDAVEKEYGPLSPTASPAALAERYRLAQGAKDCGQYREAAQGRRSASAGFAAAHGTRVVSFGRRARKRE
jgi:hypothetical protein